MAGAGLAKKTIEEMMCCRWLYSLPLGEAQGEGRRAGAGSGAHWLGNGILAQKTSNNWTDLRRPAL